MSPYGLFSDVEVAVEPMVSPSYRSRAGAHAGGDAPAGGMTLAWLLRARRALVSAAAVCRAPAVQPPAVWPVPSCHRKEGASQTPPGREHQLIRVNVEEGRQMINLVGELVIAGDTTRAWAVVFERLINGLAQLERNTRDLQEVP